MRGNWVCRRLQMNNGKRCCRMRLSKACQLLQSTSLSVREIAGRVGFQDVNYFTRAFKQRFQKTPGEFRKGN